jgi:TolB-like protein/Tfp pilus assembly protein PilF
MTDETDEKEKYLFSSVDSFGFRAAKAAPIFNYLTRAFVLDYMTRSFSHSNSGWRSLGDVAKDLDLSTSIVYAKKRNQLSPPVKELVERGFVEKRFFQRERGRGGEVMRFRIAYEKEIIRNYVEQKIRGIPKDSTKYSSALKAAVMPDAERSEVKISKLDKLRVAVLPLANISLDHSDDYFADGMTEELISAISMINGLSAISRMSIMNYKNQQNKQTIDIGRELNVGTLVMGSVRRVENRVRISVQMVDVETDRHLWTQNYDRTLEDVFIVQSDVASRVASALEVQLLPGKRYKIENANTKSIEAHLLYLKGRDSFFKWTHDALEDALKYFTQAIAVDPYYALAYSALAETYFVYGIGDYAPSEEVTAKVTEFAAKASAIDKTLPEVHLALGCSSVGKWDFKEAEKAWRRSIELNPNLSQSHCYLSCLLYALERFTESQEEARRALELDPLSSLTCFYAGSAFLFTRNYDIAIEVLKRATELDPLNAVAFANLGLARVEKGFFEKGLEEMKLAIEIEASSVNSMNRCELAYAYAKSGFDDKSQEVLSFLLKGVEQYPGWATAIAGVYSVLGNKEKAFVWLERARDVHSGFLPWIVPEPPFDNIRSDPRFEIFLSKIGLREPSQIDLLQEAQHPKAKLEEKTHTARLDARRIAVLPFTNFSPDPNDEYFADGMTDEIISTISGISGLSVISRTSVMKYKKTTKNMTEIGQELRAGKILEGSIRKSGNLVRITVQLIDSENDAHLWAQSYDRDMDDIFETQSDIALKIADALKLPSPHRDRNRWENVDAFTFCLRARSLWNRRTQETNEKAILLFEEALKIDSGSVRAVAGIADCYVTAGAWGWMDQKEAYPKAMEFVQRALELNNSLSETHVALGEVKRTVEFDYHGAETEFKKAILLNPNNADAHEGYAWILRAYGKLDEALTEAKKAYDLDPLPSTRVWLLGVSYFFVRRYNDVMAACDKIIQTQPEFGAAYFGRAMIYAIKGDREEAFQNFQIYRRLTKDEPFSDINFKCVQARIEAYLGNRKETLKLIEEIFPLMEEDKSTDYTADPRWTDAMSFPQAFQQLSYTLSLVGDGDRFFKLINYLIDHEVMGPGELRDPAYDNMREDPRWIELFKKDSLRLERGPTFPDKYWRSHGQFHS